MGKEHDAWLEGLGVCWFEANERDGGEAEIEAEKYGWRESGHGRAPTPEPEPVPKHNQMRPDCKPIRGKVPGPVNHLLCLTHGHILDVKAKTIIARSLQEYKKRWPRKGSSHSGDWQPPKRGGSGSYSGGDSGYSGGSGNYSGGGGYSGGGSYNSGDDDSGGGYSYEETECEPAPPDYSTPAPPSSKISIAEASGSFKAGVYEDPDTGASMAGVKMSGKAVGIEANADTPVGNFSASFLKAEGSATVGYDYDPESQVEFAGVKASGSASVLSGKVEGKYGNLSGQFLGASVNSKTGVEIDEKTGKTFIGTTNSADASVAAASGTLQTEDGSVKLTGEVKALTASAAADANMVVDKYGIDISGKLGAEAALFKAEAGGEIRLTPKALFDNTVGAVLGVTAPDYLDIGPVLGAKVALEPELGGTVEGGVRLGLDETNVRIGGCEELGFDLKVGMRLGPLKYLYDQQNAATPPATPEPCTPEEPVAPPVCDDGPPPQPVASADDPSQCVENAASNTWDQLYS